MIPDKKLSPPTAQDSSGESDYATNPEDRPWLRLAESAYNSAVQYTDTNFRKMWEDSIRAFNNQHPSDSKYNHPTYSKRSRIYRPKTRTVVRKNEAAAAAAYFSNMDLLSVEPQDKTSKSEAASADVMKSLLQYRLTKSIPWFQICLGGLQDAQVTSAAIAHVYWDYEEDPEGETAPVTPDVRDMIREGFGQATGANEAVTNPPPEVTIMDAGPGQSPPEIPEPVQSITTVSVEERQIKAKTDKPCIDLIPVENFLIDPGSSWVDPVNTSPYLIHLIPMYVVDVFEKMEKGEWKLLPESMVQKAISTDISSTRVARVSGREDPQAQTNQEVKDYQTVWVQRHIHRKNGIDYEFHTLGTLALLTDPAPLKERVFHGRRPYVMGTAVLETHRIMSNSLAQLGKGIQDEANEIVNQRLDNVKFVLNKKWFVKRGKDADVSGLLRNVPGGVVMLDDPMGDVREVSWPDVTGSAFEEQNRLNMDMDELMGNFNPSQIMSQAALDTPAKNMAMLSSSNGALVEYLLRTYTETFIVPIFRQLVLLEQEYETDRTVLAIAGKNAKLAQLYGIDEVTDELLNAELTLTVNVGMGATDPMQKLQKFLTAMDRFMVMMRNPVPGINMEEVGKEIFGHLGYSDGSRFFTTDNPQVAQLQGQLQQAMQLIQQLNQKVQEKQTANQLKLATAQLTSNTTLERTRIQEENENKRSLATHFRTIMSEANQVLNGDNRGAGK